MSVLPITGLPMGQVAERVLVCGDPARAAYMAEFLEQGRPLSQQREYHAYTGLYHGHPITICSHGLGGAGAAVAFEELIVAGARQILRVGTCGGMLPAMQAGELVIATSAIANVGYVQEVVPPYFPAVADPELSLALRTAARHHTTPNMGMVLTRDAFYGGLKTAATPDYAQLAQAHVLAVEMECAVLFVLGSLRQVRTAAILVVDGNVFHQAESTEHYKPHQTEVKAGIQMAITIALDAITTAVA